MVHKDILTDRQLTQLYYELARDFQMYLTLQNPPMTMQQIYNALYYGMYNSVNENGSFLRELPMSEQLKAYGVLNTFFSATWQYRDARQPIVLVYFVAPEPKPQPKEHLIIIQKQRYCCHDNLFFNLWLWSALTSNNRSYYNLPQTHRHNVHQHPIDKKKSSGEVIALLILAALAAITLALSFIALYYLLSESVSNIERFLFNEGWLQASISFFSMVASGVAFGMLASAFATAPLVNLAMAAGLSNPLGLVVFGIICIAIIGAAAGCFITKEIQKHVLKKSNPQSIDPIDPHRFTITNAEAEALMDKGIDPLKVKCAIVALRASMGDKPVAPLLGTPWNSRSKEVQRCLDAIRDLRRGKGISLDQPIVTVGEMHFDCRQDQYIAQKTGADYSPSMGVVDDLLEVVCVP